MIFSRLASFFGTLRWAGSIIFVGGPCKEAFIVHTGDGPISLQGDGVVKAFALRE
jgi:hypothetical protein